MRRMFTSMLTTVSISLSLFAILALSILALSAAAVPAQAQAAATLAPTGIAVTSVGPTSAAASSALLADGTLILLQRNQPIALPASNKPIALKAEQYGGQASGNYKLSVRYDASGAPGTVTLLLVDNGSGQTKPIPQGAGLSNPAVTWKRDGSGVAFYDFPAANKTTASTILYYDVASNQTRVLVTIAAKQAATPVAWSPDGRFLIYLVGSTDSANTNDVKPFLFDTQTSKSTPLPPDALTFLLWARSSKGFFVQGGDVTKNTSQLIYYSIDTLNAPKTLTPANTNDYLVAASPDGKRLVVTASSTAANAAQIANLYIMDSDGGNRKALTAFKAADQSVTALVWGAAGIYYSLSGANGDATTWRVNLDGSNAQQIAVGTLLDVVGS